MPAERPFPSALWEPIPAAVQDYIHVAVAVVVAVQPERCRRCRYPLPGEASQPQRPPVTARPPCNAVVTEDPWPPWSCPVGGRVLGRLRSPRASPPKGDADKWKKAVKATQEYFTKTYEQKFGSQPAINFGKDYAVIRSTLGLFKTFDEVKALIDAFLDSEKGNQFGHTLAICFSANTINLWKAGKLVAPVKTSFSTATR
jgi:hypothetical protein